MRDIKKADLAKRDYEKLRKIFLGQRRIIFSLDLKLIDVRLTFISALLLIMNGLQ
jgi:hypothetical protein